jgi:hypothetical protein
MRVHVGVRSPPRLRQLGPQIDRLGRHVGHEALCGAAVDEVTETQPRLGRLRARNRGGA